MSATKKTRAEYFAALKRALERVTGHRLSGGASVSAFDGTPCAEAALVISLRTKDRVAANYRSMSDARFDHGYADTDIPGEWGALRGITIGRNDRFRNGRFRRGDNSLPAMQARWQYMYDWACEELARAERA